MSLMESGKKISGINVHEYRGQRVYRDPLTKVGYIIPDNYANKFYFYQNRYAIVVIATILISNFVIDWLFAIPLTLIILMMFEYDFRRRFLSKMTAIPNFKPDAKMDIISRISKDEPVNKMILRIVLYFTLAALLVANCFVSKMAMVPTVLSIVTAVVVFGFGIMMVISLFRKGK